MNALYTLCSLQAVSKRAKSEKEPTLVPRVRFSSPPPPSPPSPVPHTVGTTSHPHTLTTRRAVYIKEERVEFPATEVRGQSLLKVKVCNKDKCQHQVYTTQQPTHSHTHTHTIAVVKLPHVLLSSRWSPSLLPFLLTIAPSSLGESLSFFILCGATLSLSLSPARVSVPVSPSTFPPPDLVSLRLCWL